ncbi:MAG: DUF1801 domain-containing protein [Anaerolineae bacterium]
MTKPTTVSNYIAVAPADVQPKLIALRDAIKAAAPDAQERISYGMPYYEYKGRLVYFALWKKHIGIYAISAAILDQFKDELSGMIGDKGTIQLPLNRDLPLPLIKKLVAAKVKEHDEADKK